MYTRLFSIMFGLIMLLGVGEYQVPDEQALYLPYVQKAPPVRIEWASERAARYMGHPSVAGEITNTSSRTVYYVMLSAKLYYQGEYTTTVTATTGLPATYPGEENWFELPLGWNCGGGWCEDYEVEIDSWSYKHEPAYLPLTVVDTYCSGLTTIGEIRNDNPVAVEAIETVHIPGLVYYSKGELESTTLLPGETTYSRGDIDLWCYGPPIIFAQGAIR